MKKEPKTPTATPEEISAFSSDVARFLSLTETEEKIKRHAQVVMNRIENVKAQIAQWQSKLHSLGFELADHKKDLDRVQREKFSLDKRKRNLTEEQAREAVAHVMSLRD